VAAAAIFPYRSPPMETSRAEASRGLLAGQVPSLVIKYSALTQTGRQVSHTELERLISDLFGGALERSCSH
jgi:hypothetical protein